MHFNVGDIISIQHYSITRPFSGIISEVQDDMIKVKLKSKNSGFEFLENDPLVIGTEVIDKIIIAGSIIKKVYINENIIELQIDKTDNSSNKRLYERHPVSLYASVFSLYSGKNSLAIIKDISEYGMRILTKAELNVDEILEMSIYSDRDVIFIKAYVVRELKKQNYSEYGLKINYETFQSIGVIREYIKKIKQIHEVNLNKLRA